MSQLSNVKFASIKALNKKMTITIYTNFNKHDLDQLFHQLNPKPNLTTKYILAMNLPTVKT